MESKSIEAISPGPRDQVINIPSPIDANATIALLTQKYLVLEQSLQALQHDYDELRSSNEVLTQVNTDLENQINFLNLVGADDELSTVLAPVVEGSSAIPSTIPSRDQTNIEPSSEPSIKDSESINSNSDFYILNNQRYVYLANGEPSIVEDKYFISKARDNSDSAANIFRSVRDKISPPKINMKELVEYDNESWLKFAEHLASYINRGGTKGIREYLDDDVISVLIQSVSLSNEDLSIQDIYNWKEQKIIDRLIYRYYLPCNENPSSIREEIKKYHLRILDNRPSNTTFIIWSSCLIKLLKPVIFSKDIAKLIINQIKAPNWHSILLREVDSIKSYSEIFKRVHVLVEKYDIAFQEIIRNKQQIMSPTLVAKPTKPTSNLKSTSGVKAVSNVPSTPTPNPSANPTSVTPKPSPSKPPNKPCLHCGKMGHYLLNTKGTMFLCPEANTIPDVRKAQYQDYQVKRYQSFLKNQEAKKVNAIQSSSFVTPTLNCFIEFEESNVPFLVGLDTMSCISIIPIAIYNEFFSQYPLLSSEQFPKILDVQGASLSPIGTLELHISSISSFTNSSIPFNRVSVKFMVMEKVNDILIGAYDLSSERLNLFPYLNFIYSDNPHSIDAVVDKVTSSLSDEIFELCKRFHNNEFGHLGVNRMYNVIQEYIVKENLPITVSISDVKTFIAHCPFCQKANPKPFKSPHYSFEKGLKHQVFIDLYYANDLIFLGAIYPTTDYIIMLKIESASALDTCLGIIQLSSIIPFQHIEIHSDQGTNFISSVTQELAILMGSKFVLGTPTSHQDQSFIERGFEEISRHVKPVLQYLKLNHSDTFSTEAAVYVSTSIYNNLPKYSLGGFSPNQLTFPIVSGDLEILNGTSSFELLNNLVYRQEDLLRIVIETQTKYQQKHVSIKAQGEDISTLTIGDLILVSFDAMETLGKFSYKSHGPYLVQSINRERNSLTLSSLIDLRRIMEVPIAKCSKFNYDKRFLLSPLEVSGLDGSTSYVIAIINHEGNPNDKDSLSFSVQFTNGVQVMSWNEVKSLQALDTYIDSHPELKRLKHRIRKPSSKVSAVAFSQVFDNPNMIKTDGISLNDFLFTDNITVGGSTIEQEQIRIILAKYSEVFSPLSYNSFSNNSSVILKLKDNYDSNSLFQKQRVIHNPGALESICKVLDKLIETGRIEPSPDDCPKYCSSIFAVVDDVVDGVPSYRMVVDLRHINNILVKKPYISATTMDECSQGVGNKRYKAKLDLVMSFYQLLVDENSRDFSTIQHPINGNFYRFKGLPMGNCNSPAELQAFMDKELNHPKIFTYFDDILTGSDNFEEFLFLLELILQTCSRCNLKLKPSKCFINTESIEVLGRKLTGDYRSIDDSSFERIKSMSIPTTKTQLQSSLGALNWVRGFIPHFGELAAPLYKLISQDNKRLKWNDNEIAAWKLLKEAALNPVKLYAYKDSLPLYVISDASESGWSCLIYQIQNDSLEKPLCSPLDPSTHLILAMTTGAWNSTEIKWKTIEQECYAFYRGIVSNEILLSGRPFFLLTDHKNLTFLSDPQSAKVFRWLLALQQFSFTAIHIKGTDNLVADALSRIQ